jgi:hypothetical protein
MDTVKKIERRKSHEGRLLGRSAAARLFKTIGGFQHAGPMSMGPYTVKGDLRNKQQGEHSPFDE